MSKAHGWVKLHRSMKDWEWYRDANTYRLFTHLMITVNWEDKEWQGITIKRGSIVTSLAHLAEQTGLSVKQVRGSLDKLKGTSDVAVKATNRYSIVSLCKYDTYQSEETQKGKQKGKPRDKQRATTKEDKEERTEADESFFFSGIDIRTINPLTREGKKRTRKQLEQLAKLESQGIKDY